MARRKKAERTQVRVPNDGWWMVGKVAGPLPELHRLHHRQELALTKEGAYITACDLMVRRIVEIPPGVWAHLCKNCR